MQDLFREDSADCWPNNQSHRIQATAERLGVMHLLDKRFAGVAKGVGSGKILGRIHQVHTDMSFEKTCSLPSLSTVVIMQLEAMWTVPGQVSGMQTSTMVASEGASQPVLLLCRH